MIPYKERVLKLIPNFDGITFHHTPQEENQLVHALANLASMFKVKWENEALSIHIDYLDESAYCLAAEDESDGHPWFYDIMRYLEIQEYLENAFIIDKKYLWKLSAKFFLS